MDLYPSSSSISAFTSMSKVTESTSAILAVAASAHKEKDTTERNVTANKVTRLAASIMTGRSTLHRLAFFLQGLMEKDTNLLFFFSLTPSCYQLE